MEAYTRSEQTKSIPQGGEIQNGDTGNHQNIPPTGGVDHSIDFNTQGSGPSAPQHTSWRGPHRYRPYVRKDQKSSGSTDQSSQQQQPSAGVVQEAMDVGEVPILIFLSPINKSLMNDNHCLDPTCIQVSQVQLDPKSLKKHY